MTNQIFATVNFTCNEEQYLCLKIICNGVTMIVINKHAKGLLNHEDVLNDSI